MTGDRLTEDESDYLWEKRNYLYDYPSALPRMIQVSVNDNNVHTSTNRNREMTKYQS